MNRYFTIFIVIALFVGSNNASNSLPKNIIYFKNSFSQDDDVLKVHCRSEKDDLGLHYVRHNLLYDIKFGDDFWGRTIFKCELTHGINYTYSRKFTAYRESYYFYKFGRTFYWDAHDDGIYFAYDGGKLSFKYGW